MQVQCQYPLKQNFLKIQFEIQLEDAWFKVNADKLLFFIQQKSAPCKAEDLTELAGTVISKADVLFLHHINVRQLTLSQALELVLKRWVDCIKYFVEYIPKQTDYKGTPAKNKRSAKIRKCLVKHELFLFFFRF